MNTRELTPRVYKNFFMEQWFLLETRGDYQKALKRFEEIHQSKKGTPEHKEKMLLVFLISKWEKEHWDAPEPDPVEIIKGAMEHLNLTASDLAKEYGDKGTISKVLNYKQALSLTMIRKFSKLLGLPVEALVKEYKLKEDN